MTFTSSRAARRFIIAGGPPCSAPRSTSSCSPARCSPPAGRINQNAEDSRPPVPRPEVDPKMPYFLVCAKACDDCARICDTCSAHCSKIVADGKNEHLHTLKLCLDCSAVCRAARPSPPRTGPWRISSLGLRGRVQALRRCLREALQRPPHEALCRRMPRVREGLPRDARPDKADGRRSNGTKRTTTPESG